MVACAPQVTTQTSGGLDQKRESKYANYDGLRAKVVVAPFSCKAEKCGSGPNEAGVAISDLLMTALVNTNYFIAYDRSVLEQIQKEAQLGQSDLRLEGADILITGSVTAFEPDVGGRKGGGGGEGIIRSLPLTGGLFGSEKKAYVAVDIRMVDAKTGALIGAFRVEGEASDTNFGGLLGGVLPAGTLEGALSQYQKTPMGKALAVMVANAVDEIIKRIPQKYFRYTEDGQVYQIQDNSSEGAGKKPTPTPTPTNTPMPTATPAPTNTPTPTLTSLPLSPISAIPDYVFPEPPKTLGKIKKYHIEHSEIFNRDYIIVPHDGIETQNVYMPFDGWVLYYEIDAFTINLQIDSGSRTNDVTITLIGPFVPQKILKEDTDVEVKKGTLIATIDKSKALHETILFDAYGLYKGNLPDDINILFTYLPEMFK